MEVWKEKKKQTLVGKKCNKQCYLENNSDRVVISGLLQVEWLGKAHLRKCYLFFDLIDKKKPGTEGLGRGITSVKALGQEYNQPSDGYKRSLCGQSIDWEERAEVIGDVREFDQVQIFVFQLLYAVSFLSPQLEYNFLKEENNTNLFFLSLVAPSCLVHILVN